jgi:hypothetical protein
MGVLLFSSLPRCAGNVAGLLKTVFSAATEAKTMLVALSVVR